MANINLGPAQTQTANTEAVLAPQFTPNFGNLGNGTNAYRVLAIGRAVPLSGTGDALFMPIVNSGSWAPAVVVTANGQVNGVQGSIASASIGLFTGAASTGTTIKTQAALAANSAAGSSIVIASNTVILAFTATGIFVNVGTALAGATVDVWVYGYDQT
jgi:hypothetical protein